LRNSSMPYFPSNNGGAIFLQSYAQSGNLNISSSGTYSCGTDIQLLTSSPLPGTGAFADEGWYLAATFAYRYLTLNDSMRNADPDLLNFYESLVGTSIDKFMQIEMKVRERKFDE